MILIMSVFFSSVIPDGIFNVAIKTIEGKDIALNNYAGKKIVVVILPSTQTDADISFLKGLDSLSKANSNTVFLGICSYEDGFTEEAKTDLNNYYRVYMGNQVVISAGMYTRKNAANQHPLFSWLTDKNKNIHFNEDAAGPGQKFFITENGELKAIYGSAMPLSSSRIAHILE